MWYLIEGLAEVQENDVSLIVFVEIFSKVITCKYQLSFTRTFFAEAMLRITESVVDFQVIYNSTVDDVF